MPDSQPTVKAIIRQVAHQIRQPLSVIEAIAYYLDLVLPETGEEARSYVGKLRQQAHEIDRILSDTIHFVQASPPRFEPVDLSKLVSHHLEDWPPAADLNVEVQLAGDLPCVDLDVQQAQHLLSNLLLLFEKIVPAGDRIVLRTSSNATEVFLEIEAEKSNYAAGQVTEMFEPFAAHAAGGGLMLASVQRVAETHHARISIHPDLDEGISISVAFPARALTNLVNSGVA